MSMVVVAPVIFIAVGRKTTNQKGIVPVLMNPKSIADRLALDSRAQ
jgi:hypothetical protein